MLKKDKKKIIQKLTSILKNINSTVQCSAIPMPQRYPCSVFRLSIYFWENFPDNISDNYPFSPEEQIYERLFVEGQDKRKEIWPYIQSIDNQIQQCLQSVGIIDYSEALSYHKDSFHGIYLTVPFFPLWDEESEQFKYGRWMTDEEYQKFEKKMKRKPFSDEAWIIERYTGINVFRQAMIHEENLCLLLPGL